MSQPSGENPSEDQPITPTSKELAEPKKVEVVDDRKDEGHDHKHDGHDHKHGGHAHGHDKLKNPDGTWKYTNRLSKESSPYLLQHAHNPVDWYAWGPEAFEAARKEGKPIFLSIGYSTCYWCHVMERQSFENEDIARKMNELFICVKVDREERPDVDDIYMAATQLMTGGGGWPMSVFMTPPGTKGEKDPGLKPFFCGTYFPPTGQFGRPGFPDLLEGISTAWTAQRNQVVEQSEKVAKAVSNHLGQREGIGEVGKNMVQTSVRQLMRTYEPVHGGFGRAPKFPTPNNQQFLMAVHQTEKNDDLWKMLVHTLDRMARGGMYDQVGGGFHRYSTDAQWLVPHFEKMLYDNGQLVELYLTAHKIQPREDDPDFYKRVVREICEYVLREMLDETGTFWSAQDAEVDAKEGDNYVWLPDQINDAIKDKELAELALKMYGLDRGTNFQDPHHKDLDPVNVIYLPDSLADLSKELKISLEDLLKKQKQIDQLLLAVRDKRKQPGTDDKVIVSWNGLMIAGMARAGKELPASRYTDAAKKAADYILEKMRDENGGLIRTMRKGKGKQPAFLEDYSFFVHGLIEIHRTTDDSKYLDAAEELTAHAIKLFGDDKKDGGGYYDTLADQSDLFVRTRSKYDGAVPTGNSQMVHNLVDLYTLTEKESYIDRAANDLRSFAGALMQMGASMAHMQHALLKAMNAAPAKFEKAVAAVPTKKGVVQVVVDQEKVDVSKGEATIAITLTIDKTYHINAPDPGLESLIPTTVRLEQGKGLDVEVKFPKAISKKLPLGDEPVNMFEGKVVITATIKKTGDVAANAKPVLVLSYQACTDDTCLRPEEVELPVTISVE